MNKLAILLDQLETKITHAETLNQDVSNASVAWHIEHSLLTLNGVSDSLIQSKPTDYKWTFNFIRLIVLTMKKIPRGRAKSPKVVEPQGELDSLSLARHLMATKYKVEELEQLSADKFFEHPFFGKLKRNQTINFLEIHTQHHLEIIDDIIDKNRK